MTKNKSKKPRTLYVRRWKGLRLGNDAYFVLASFDKGRINYYTDKENGESVMVFKEVKSSKGKV